MVEILAGLEHTDWSGLTHAYGPAGKTPEQLRAVLDGDAHAVIELDVSLYHEGGCVYPAAAAAVPFLIELACEPTVVHRRQVLELLTCFALLLGDLREPWRTRGEALSLGESMRSALPRFIALLDDADRSVRIEATELLAAFDTGTAPIADALRRRFAVEPDYPVRAQLVLGLGELAERLTDNERAACEAWAGEVAQTDARIRLATLITRHRLVPEAVAAREVLDALADPALVAEDYLATAESPADLVRWIAHRYDDSGFQAKLALWGLRRARIDGTASALTQAGTVMLRSREATAMLVGHCAGLLDHHVPEVRSGAAHLLAASGRCALPYADGLAAAARDADAAVATRAVWALARMGDGRAVAELVSAIDAVPERFPIGGVHYQAPTFMLTDLPGLADVLLSMRAHAPALIPALRRRLARAGDTPDLYTVTRVLSHYGSSALEALPELRALLSTKHRDLACHVLGMLGEGAAELAGYLRRIVRAADRSTDESEGNAAAWAYFRITGDADTLLRRVNLAKGFSTSPHAFRQLADLGRHAGDLAGPVGAMLESDRSSWPTWTGVEAAYAHWQISGDNNLCIEVFDAALDPLRSGRQLPVSRQVLRYLPELGADAARFQALLTDVVAGKERLVYAGGWRGLAEDDEAVGLAQAVLRGVTPS